MCWHHMNIAPWTLKRNELVLFDYWTCNFRLSPLNPTWDLLFSVFTPTFLILESQNNISVSRIVKFKIHICTKSLAFVWSGAVRHLHFFHWMMKPLAVRSPEGFWRLRICPPSHQSGAYSHCPWSNQTEAPPGFHGPQIHVLTSGKNI